jgi:AraC-like DNA-binding protein
MKLHKTNKTLHSKGNNQQSGETIYRVRENICQHLFAKGLISKLYKGPRQLTSNKVSNSTKKMEKTLNRHFSEKGIK